MQVEVTRGYLRADQPTPFRRVSFSPKSPYVRENASPELVRIELFMVGHRVGILRNFHLRMSDIGTTLCVLGTDPQSLPAILLLRTIAIYSGSRRVAIPLSIVYAVRSGTNTRYYVAHHIHRHS